MHLIRVAQQRMKSSGAIIDGNMLPCSRMNFGYLENESKFRGPTCIQSEQRSNKALSLLQTGFECRQFVSSLGSSFLRLVRTVLQHPYIPFHSTWSFSKTFLNPKGSFYGHYLKLRKKTRLFNFDMQQHWLCRKVSWANTNTI
jgi:hypothetical protein